jgi:DNA-binding transcriptional regulator YiaG
MTIASMLSRWRKRRQLSQQAAADLVGVPLATWQNWEQGRNKPRGLALVALRERLNVELSGQPPKT